MRILMLSDLYPPFIGGIEQHVRNLSKGLVKRGHHVVVATKLSPGLPESDLDEGVSVHRIRGSAQRGGSVTQPTGRPHSPPFPDPEVARAVNRIVSELKPDVIHAHDWMVRSFLPLTTRGRPGLVVTLHNYGNVCAKVSYMYRGQPCTGPGFAKCLGCAARNYGTARGMAITLGNWVMQPFQQRSVGRFLAVSNAVAEGNRLAGQSVPFEVLPNFVPDDVAALADDDDPALRNLPDEPYWLYVGALSRHKGVHVLLQAYAGLEGVPPLVIIGPPWKDTPKRFPRNTIVLHSLAHRAVMAAWRRSALGVIPSIFPDPCPTVAMEAMACGVPLVASRIGGLPDLVAHDQTGLLVTYGDPLELRAALQRFSSEPELGLRMGIAAKVKVSSFTATTVIDRLETIYSELTRESTMDPTEAGGASS